MQDIFGSHFQKFLFVIYHPTQSVGFDECKCHQYVCILYRQVNRHVYHLMYACNDCDGLVTLLSYLNHGNSQAA